MFELLQKKVQQQAICYGQVSLLTDEEAIIVVDEGISIDQELKSYTSEENTTDHTKTIFITYKSLENVREKYACIAYFPLVYIGLFSSSQIEALLFQKAFENELLQHNIAKEAIGGIGSIYLKKHEYAFLECARKLEVSYETFSEEMILKTFIYNPSKQLKNRIGVSGVAEPVAQLLSKNEKLIVDKTQITVPSYKVFTYAISIGMLKKQ